MDLVARDVRMMGRQRHAPGRNDARTRAGPARYVPAISTQPDALEATTVYASAADRYLCAERGRFCIYWDAYDAGLTQ